MAHPQWRNSVNIGGITRLLACATVVVVVMGLCSPASASDASVQRLRALVRVDGIDAPVDATAAHNRTNTTGLVTPCCTGNSAAASDVLVCLALPWVLWCGLALRRHGCKRVPRGPTAPSRCSLLARGPGSPFTCSRCRCGRGAAVPPPAVAGDGLAEWLAQWLNGDRAKLGSMAHLAQLAHAWACAQTAASTVFMSVCSAVALALSSR